MKLLRNGEFLEEDWTRLEDDEDVPAGARIIVSIERLTSQFKSLMLHEAGLAVDLPNDRDVEEIADFLEALDAVVLAFPAFTDGRAYSQARQLRERFGYRGELRATGNVLPDQLAFMRQCGVDAFEVSGRFDIEDWQRAATSMTLTYQSGYLPERGYSPADIWKAREGKSGDTLRSDFEEVWSA